MRTEIGTVAIVGGTHGNEITGPHLLRHWRRQPAEITRASFETRLHLGNPKAFQANRRFIDEDLNRSFASATLAADEPSSYEAARAVVLNQRLGPRGSPATDFLIDLHTSTSHCGAMLIVLSDDAFSLRLAAYVASRIDVARVHYIPGQDQDPPYLGSVARHCLGVEIGPVPQGVLRYDAFERSRQVVLAALDFVHESNLGAPIPLPRTLEVYRFRETVALPGEGPYKDAIVHESLQDRDYAPLHPGDPLLRRLDGSVINYDGDGVRHPVFVNEAAYYANGIAMMLTSLETLVVPD
ncbi:MAG: aspartoacylase [Burkholderiaceae bacterium]|nr:aspartoacylase [Burkholderiaceae bacterium]